MVSVRAYIIAGGVAFAGIAAGTGLAQLPDPLPPDQNVQVNIREDAKDPTSAITHKVNVLVTAVAVERGEVAWEATQLFIRRIAALGEVEALWGVDRPAIDTPDGLWWTVPADPMTPYSGDFNVLPPMAGTAVSPDPSIEDMQYDLVGSPYVEPPQGSLFRITGLLTYTLGVVADPPVQPAPVPEAGGEEEPVEMPEDPEDPYG